MIVKFYAIYLNKSMLLKVFMAKQIAHLEWVQSTEVHIGFCYKNKNVEQNQYLNLGLFILSEYPLCTLLLPDPSYLPTPPQMKSGCGNTTNNTYCHLKKNPQTSYYHSSVSNHCAKILLQTQYLLASITIR